VDSVLLSVRGRPARQQPVWGDAELLRRVGRELAAAPALVGLSDVVRLRAALARVAAGEARVLQAGDCAEDPAECGRGSVVRKADLLDRLADRLGAVTGRPVLRVGRIAGQFAKPRSRSTEWVGGMELDVFRGHMTNSPEPDPEGRRPDPRRILVCYRAAREIMGHLGWYGGCTPTAAGEPMWTSHEALMLDYELPMVRREQGEPVLTSTHWPWIGERTRQVDGAHVELLSRVVNPVACKVGPTMTADELLALCAALDPDRQPGRLTLIARMGAELIADRLPPLVRAVRAAGHPVIWLSDPMHGNTVTTPDGLKTRYVEVVEQEIARFQQVLRAESGVDGGLHLEITPDEVTECVRNASYADQAGVKYTSFCDPRLNPAQALSVVAAWRP
jgi:3-deoxy-7-phosphoheptulonate synthase